MIIKGWFMIQVRKVLHGIKLFFVSCSKSEEVGSHWMSHVKMIHGTPLHLEQDRGNSESVERHTGRNARWDMDV